VLRERYVPTAVRDEAVFFDVLQALSPSTENLHEIAQRINSEIEQGLAGKPSSLAMLDTFASLPTGQETGLYVAVNWGGSNLTYVVVRLKGKGKYEVLERPDPIAFTPDDLKNPARVFETIARQVGAYAGPDKGKPVGIGFIFSYPMKQTSLNSGTLMYDLELGGFNQVRDIQTEADRILDRETKDPKPGEQLFEKMISAYICRRSSV